MGEAGEMGRILRVWTALVLLAYASAETTIAKTQQQCCNVKLMDSAGYVMIEAMRDLPVGQTYKSVLLNMCSTGNDNFNLLILNKISGKKDDLKTYQYTVAHSFNIVTTAYPYTGRVEEVCFKLPYEFTIQPDQYFAVFAAESKGIPTPFEFDAVNTTYTFFLSTSRYMNAGELLVPGKTISHQQPIRWPRLWLDSAVKFSRDVDCRDRSSIILTVMGPPGVAGPPGPPGPPGTPGTNQLIGQDELTGGKIDISCDVPDVENKVDDAKVKIEILSQQVTQMQQALFSIYNSNSVTGICPTGMVAGTYGVGSCYIIRRELVPMAVAELRCRQDFDAHLVTIETEIEERFLRLEILKSGNSSRVITADAPDSDAMEYFWTSLMFSKEEKLWVWYNEERARKSFLQYFNFGEAILPQPKDDNDVCSTLAVDYRTTTSYWEKTDCNKHRFYVCEIGKRCL